MHVLLAEDDRAVRESLVRALGLEGYQVTAAINGAQALEALHAGPVFDVVLLDVSMPVVDGLTVCRALRAHADPAVAKLPILMLTARTEIRDRVAGLDAGADDYLPKPFHLDELFARVRALVRRTAPADATTGSAGGDTLRLGDLEIRTAGREVLRGGRPIELSKTEFDLLELLVRNTGIVLDHTTIYERIWHYDFGPESKNLAVYIGYLRRKTEFADEGVDGAPRLIHTVRGVGYVARVDQRILT
ncbi:MAG TPA: response regulator transcription factor [Ilumatobacter sp.]|nr:response regulator transcription factor [Ilumatobacter sp.]